MSRLSESSRPRQPFDNDYELQQYEDMKEK